MFFAQTHTFILHTRIHTLTHEHNLHMHAFTVSLPYTQAMNMCHYIKAIKSNCTMILYLENVFSVL